MDELKAPKNIKCLYLMSLFEGFCFYGFKSLMLIHLTEKFNMDHQYVHLFLMFVYLSGYAAKMGMKKYGKLHMSFMSFLMVFVGSLFIALSSVKFDSEVVRILSYHVGRVFLAVGFGGLKFILFLLGCHQFDTNNEDGKIKRDKFIFRCYFVSELGALLALPLTLLHSTKFSFSHKISDGFPMCFGTFALASLIGIIVLKLSETSFKPEELSQESAEDELKKLTEPEIKMCKEVSTMFIFLTSVFLVFDRMASLWILQGTKMRNVATVYHFKPNQMFFLDPLFVLLFVPLVKLIKSPPLRKINLGMILAAISLLIGFYVERGIISDQVTSIHQSPQYLFMGLAKAMIIPNILEIIFSIVPHSLHSRVYSFWMMSQLVANFIGFLISVVYTETDYIANLIAVEFPILAAVLAGSAIAFYLKSRQFSIAEARKETKTD